MITLLHLKLPSWIQDEAKKEGITRGIMYILPTSTHFEITKIKKLPSRCLLQNKGLILPR
jgi:hypothetical protein